MADRFTETLKAKNKPKIIFTNYQIVNLIFASRRLPKKMLNFNAMK